MLAVQQVAHLPGDLRGSDPGVGRQDVPDLGPRGRHEFFLTLLNDLGAQVRRYPEPGVEVEAVDPVAIVRDRGAVAFGEQP